MQESQRSQGLPRVMARRVRLVIASASFSVILFPGGILANYRFLDVANDDVLSLAVIVMSCLAPLLGVSAVLMARKDLEWIRRGIIPSSVRNLTTWGRLLGFAGAAGNTVSLLVFLMQAFSFSGATAARESMIDDLKRISAHAYLYRTHPASNDSGESTYARYVIPAPLAGNEKAYYTATILHADTIQFTGTWREDSASTVTIRIGSDGRFVQPWIYTGDFALIANTQ